MRLVKPTVFKKTAKKPKQNISTNRLLGLNCCTINLGET
jgi:hypothetical protein